MPSSVPVSSMPPRKSFAEVAAAAHAPLNPKDKQQNQNPQSPNSRPDDASPLIVSPDSVAVSLSEEIQPQPLVAQESTNGPKPLDGATLKAHMQTQASSIESFSRRDNSDTKSVTSRTTLTLDEKESLRPDDSASVQAAVEDDRPSSAAGSRLGAANSEARAFSDQLHEIGRSDQPRDSAQRGMPHIVFPLPRNPSSGIMYAGSPAPVPYQQPVIVDPNQFRSASGSLALPPDEKLMEALASPKDRLFVLKVEQDIIDFVKDSKENVLILPQTNSFYRMLSHKLADYYCLDHAVDESMQSVRISRTPHCRLPISLISMSTGTEGPTPPPSAPARKIMRRNEGYQSSGLNTENPSKTTSEAGVMSGSEEGTPAKDKSQMTREERESRYNEARARIFSDWKHEASENGDSTSAQNDVENSRSSSPSRGKKSGGNAAAAAAASKKKKPKDDSFEPRSTFNAMPNQPFVSNSMQQQISNMAMFNAFQNLNVSGPYQTSSSQPQSPSQINDPSLMSQQPQQYVQQQGQWYSQGQQYPMGYNVMSYPPHQGQQQFTDPSQAPAFNGYNPYGPQSMGAETTPKPGNAAPAVYQQGQNYPNQMVSPMWQRPAGNYPNSYGMPVYGGFPNAPQPYQQPQGQQQPMTYHEAQAWNAFQSQQFNPMSQSFVPSFGQQQPSPNAARFGASPAGLQRQVSNTSHASSPLKGARSGPQSPRPKDMKNGPLLSSASPGVLSPPQSSISKWANSTSLPSKPPAPKPDKPSVPPNPMAKPSSS